MTQRHCNYLLSLLGKTKSPCRRDIEQFHAQLITANLLFSPLSSGTTAPNLTLVNTLLRHYSLGSHFPEGALLLFKHIQQQNQSHPFSFDSFTYSFLIKACANLQRPIIGTQLHGLTTKSGFELHIYVQTALVNVYADCGCFIEAKKVFEEMPERNSVTWNVLITGFIKWGELGFAKSLFDVMPMKNVVSWTGLIDGYTRSNHYKEALALFRKMVVDEGIKPTQVTILAVFPAIWNLGCLKFCQIIHTYGEKSGFNASDIRVTNSLLDAYAKCGCVESALRVFEDTPNETRNVVSWTSIISGFAMHGMGREATDSFRRMQNAYVKPNRVTFLSVLNACSHGGLVNEGLHFFKKMDKCGVVANMKHYGCLIDMLGRAGRLDEAEKMALDIPMEMVNVVIWRTLLGACSFHGNVEVAERVTRKIMEIERGYGGDYVLVSNIFAGVGRYADSESVRRVMDERNVSKILALSLTLSPHPT